jgi:hypothetical protein
MAQDSTRAQLIPETARLARLQRFLLERVQSYEQLEILLLLFSSREFLWAPGAISDKLELSELDVSDALDALRSRGLVTALKQGAGFIYAPESAAMNRMVMDLATACESQRLEIMKAMTANAMQRLRNSTVNAFDALASVKKHEDCA